MRRRGSPVRDFRGGRSRCKKGNDDEEILPLLVPGVGGDGDWRAELAAATIRAGSDCRSGGRTSKANRDSSAWRAYSNTLPGAGSGRDGHGAANLQTICLFASAPEHALHGSLLEMNEKLKGRLEQIRKPALFRAELGDTIAVAAPPGSLGAKRLLITDRSPLITSTRTCW